MFRECVEVLNAKLPSLEESFILTDIFKDTYPLTRWGKIDWDEIDYKIDVGYDQNNILPALQQLIQKPIDTSVYIEWSDGGLPIIKADLLDIIKHFDDVTCVAFEKFIFNPYVGYIIEILPGDSMAVGLVEPLCKEVV